VYNFVCPFEMKISILAWNDIRTGPLAPNGRTETSCAKFPYRVWKPRKTNISSAGYENRPMLVESATDDVMH
jgi:hypothetical protein